MARRYLKDEDGIPLITQKSNRSRAFQVAETISVELGIEAVITRARDSESGGEGLGIYVTSHDGELSPAIMQEAIELWREYI